MKPYSFQKYNSIATKYRIGITNKKSLFDQQRDTIRISPGNQTMIKVLPRLFRTTADFNALTRKQRNCKLPHETDGFTFLKEYSRKGCEFECAAKKAVSICKCIAWYIPNNFMKWPICEMFGGYCFDLIISDERNYKKCKEQCLTDCHETTYIVLSSNVEIDLDAACHPSGFHYQHFKEAFTQYFAFHSYKTLIDEKTDPDLRTSFIDGSLCKSFVKNYVSFVSVESPTSLIITTNKDRRIYFYDQLGTFGGTLGLFAGFSVISFFEVFFLLFNIAIETIKIFSLKSIKDFITMQIGEPEKSNSNTKMDNVEQQIQVS